MENKKTRRELHEWIKILSDHRVITTLDGISIIGYSELPDNKNNIEYNQFMVNPSEIFNTFYWDTTSEGLGYWHTIANKVSDSFVAKALTILGDMYAPVILPDYKLTLQTAKAFGKNNGFEVDPYDIDLLVACHLLYIVEDYELGIFLRILPTDVFLIREAIKIVTTKFPDYVVC